MTTRPKLNANQATRIVRVRMDVQTGTTTDDATFLAILPHNAMPRQRQDAVIQIAVSTAIQEHAP